MSTERIPMFTGFLAFLTFDICGYRTNIISQSVSLGWFISLKLGCK